MTDMSMMVIAAIVDIFHVDILSNAVHVKSKIKFNYYWTLVLQRLFVTVSYYEIHLGHSSHLK